MQLASPVFADPVRRLLPDHNPNPEDRAQAWNQWLSSGGADPVLRYIRWSNGTDADDDEIFQETLITAYLKVERGAYEQRGAPFTAFLKKIAAYKILEASRWNARHVALDDILEYADDEAAADDADRWKEREALQSALDRLPQRRSQVLLLYEHGYSTAEIAERFEISEELVRKEKSLGLRQLRDRLTLAIAS